MGNRHQQTLEEIFADPVKASIAWREIEAMLENFGAEISEGRGSRVRISLNGVRAVFHRPHPQKETNRATVRDLRDFLREAGIVK